MGIWGQIFSVTPKFARSNEFTFFKPGSYSCISRKEQLAVLCEDEISGDAMILTPFRKLTLLNDKEGF